jgi:hypothetical protein
LSTWAMQVFEEYAMTQLGKSRLQLQEVSLVSVCRFADTV